MSCPVCNAAEPACLRRGFKVDADKKVGGIERDGVGTRF
jgi:hypothetical protein